MNDQRNIVNGALIKKLDNIIEISNNNELKKDNYNEEIIIKSKELIKLCEKDIKANLTLEEERGREFLIKELLEIRLKEAKIIKEVQINDALFLKKIKNDLDYLNHLSIRSDIETKYSIKALISKELEDLNTKYNQNVNIEIYARELYHFAYIIKTIYEALEKKTVDVISEMKDVVFKDFVNDIKAEIQKQGVTNIIESKAWIYAEFMKLF